jgi:hypothetical protein
LTSVVRDLETSKTMPEPDGPQFQNLWDIAMSDANDALDAASDEDLDEAVAESMISDAIGGMVDASQIEETGHTQAELSPQDRAFASRNQATYDAAEEMASRIRRGYERPPIHPADALDYPGDDMNVEGPNYDEPDPFDRSNPEEARQAKAIEDMNETLGE